jgi:signal transduction histidine kinase
LIGAVREVRPRPVMLADVLETVVHQHGIAEDLLQVDIAPEAAYVIADSTQLTRAFGNMIQNAVDAGAKSVTVSAHLIEAKPGRRSSPRAVVSITDLACLPRCMSSRRCRDALPS